MITFLQKNLCSTSSIKEDSIKHISWIFWSGRFVDCHGYSIGEFAIVDLTSHCEGLWGYAQLCSVYLLLKGNIISILLKILK